MKSSSETVEIWSCGTCGDRDVPDKFRIFGSCYRCAAQRSIDKRNRQIKQLMMQLVDASRVPSVAQDSSDPEGARLSNWLADYSQDLMEDGDFDQEAAEINRAAQWIADHLGNAQAVEVTPAMLDAGTQALINDDLRPLSEIDVSKYRRRALLVLKAASSVPSTQDRCPHSILRSLCSVCSLSSTPREAGK